MKTYVSPEQFARISKGKVVRNFPNELIKEIGGVTFQIVPHGLKCTVEKVAKESYPWYLRMDEDSLAQVTKELFGYRDTEVYRLSCEWFPTDLVAGVEYGRFSSFAKLSKKTGFLEFGYAGSDSCFFIGSKVNEAIEILRKKGFMFDKVNKL